MADIPAFLHPLPDGFLADAAAFAGHLADLAGAAIRPYFRQPLDVESKADASPDAPAVTPSTNAFTLAFFKNRGKYGAGITVNR